jgi:hypothetical protein
MLDTAQAPVRVAGNGIQGRFGFFCSYYIRCRADKVRYLCTLGGRIGRNCSIYTSVHNFGTEPWLIEKELTAKLWGEER